jgi:hypothetical protein
MSVIADGWDEISVGRNEDIAMMDPMLEKMGGERICQLCGYIERDVYRLFCPHCMQRDRLSPLTAMERAHEIISPSSEPQAPSTHPIENASML